VSNAFRRHPVITATLVGCAVGAVLGSTCDGRLVAGAPDPRRRDRRGGVGLLHDRDEDEMKVEGAGSEEDASITRNGRSS
jgi:hypothetical protein